MSSLSLQMSKHRIVPGHKLLMVNRQFCIQVSYVIDASGHIFMDHVGSF